jgi:hypothetical protein
MTDGTEAAVDTLTGAVVAAAVEPSTGGAGDSHPPEHGGKCLNCGAVLAGPYCSQCGQGAHIHRSLLSLGHDILHGVFHFEGKIWRTLPELALHPGRLTRRYIEGERAKFVSPMALYLFAVFLMYAVFSFTGGVPIGAGWTQIPSGLGQGFEEAAADTRRQLDAARLELADPTLSPERRAEVERQAKELETAVEVTASMAKGDFLTVIQGEKSSANNGEQSQDGTTRDGPVRRFLQRLTTNRELIAYKIKTNGYKYGWLLVPLSIPFLWLMFLGRRGVTVYDHAVFVTYSLSFMMLLLVAISLLKVVGVAAGVLSFALQSLAVVHLYAHLRGTYSLTWGGAAGRLVLVVISAAIVLVIFVGLLVLLGVLG